MSQPPPLPRPPAAEPGWWKRNLLWAIPALIAAAGGIIFAFFVGLLSLLKSCDAYKEAWDRANRSSVVAGALGLPLKEPFFIQGRVNVVNDSGVAELAVPLKGPKGEGTMYLLASKKQGQWGFEKLSVSLPGGGSVDLREGLGAPPLERPRGAN